MMIYLLDFVKDKEVMVNVNVEYTLPCSDLFIIFSSLSETCQFEEGQFSQPYHQYQWQKVNHIMGASLDYEGKSYSLTLGFFRSDLLFIPFIMSHKGSDSPRFATAQDYYDFYFSSQVLFTYPPHPTLLSSDQEPLTFKEVVSNAIKRENEGNIGYCLPPSKALDLAALVGQQQFNAFIEQEAKRFGIE